VLERLAKSATEMVVEPKTVLIREGDRADALYVLLDGVVEVKARGENGTRTRKLRTMTAPSYVGEIGLLQGVPRTATVVAKEPCRVLRIDGDEFVAALSETPLSASFVSGMTMRLARTIRRRPSRSRASGSRSRRKPTEPLSV